MPLFSRSKKGSQPSGPSLAESYARADSRQTTERPLPHIPIPSEESRDTVPSPQYRGSRPPNQIPIGATPYHAHTAADPPQSENTSPNFGGPRSPTLDVRTEPEPRRSFKERLGLGSSRENLLDLPENNPRTTGLRRKLSSRHQGARSPPPHVVAPTERSSTPVGLARRATFGNQQVESRVDEQEELRELSSFLRTTAPSHDQRRPYSIVGTPSGGQAQWAAEPREAEGSAVLRRGRTNSLDDRVPRSDDRAYGIVVPPEDDVRDQELAYQTSSPVSQSQSTGVPVQDISPTSGKSGSFLNTNTTPVQSRPPSDIQYPLQQQPQQQQQQNQLPVVGLPERKASLQPSLYSIEQDQQAEESAAQIDYDPRLRQEDQQMPANPMPGNLRPPSRRSSQTPPGTPGRLGDMSQQMQQHQQQQFAAAQGMSGRRTPEPPPLERDVSGMDVAQSAQYRELREKYTKVKRYYFEKEDQVKSLQNALAHQKLAASRTSLDDFEYISRLTRLDGLISQLAYGFRKDWVTVPPWLQPYLNRDAIRVGKQECTALGRAFISEWLAREVFETYFHPGLDLDVSRELKAIQRNIRLLSPPLHTPEEDEALTARITNWRLATMDGLAQTLNSPEAAARRSTLVELLNRQLVTALLEHLHNPPPPGIEGGAHMIVELAVSVLLHLPGESRDVSIEYYNPGSLLNPDLMRLETGIPPLGQPMAELPSTSLGRSSSPLGGIGGPDTADRASDDSSGDDDGADDVASDNVDNDSASHTQSHAKKGLFSGLVGGGGSGGGKTTNRSPPSSSVTSAGAKHGASNSSQLSLPQGQGPGQSGQPGLKDAGDRVRLCVFLGAGIRARGVLVQAPVYRL